MFNTYEKEKQFYVRKQTLVYYIMAIENIIYGNFNQKWMAQCERLLCLSINYNEGLLIFISYDKTIKS